MKKTLVVTIALIASITSFAQGEYGSSSEWNTFNTKSKKSKTYSEVKDTTPIQKNINDEEKVPDLKNFENSETGLFISKVIELPNKNQKEILNQFKNWGATSFVSLKEVMVSETENQIVLVYITEPTNYFKSLGMKTFYDIKHYVRMVIQSKDGKCKISMFDDGNVYKIGSYVGNIKMPDISARSRYFYYFDTKDKPAFEDLHKSKGYMWGVYYSWQTKLESMLASCENGLKNENSIKKLNDDF